MASPTLYGFNRDDATILKSLAQTNRLGAPVGVKGGAPQSILAGGSAVGAWVVQAEGAITGASYSTNITPGTGTVRLMKRGTTYLEAHQDGSADVTETVYSLLPHAILDDGIVLAMRTMDGDLWVVQWLDMPRLFCRFITTASFTTSSASVAGTIQNQYGPGRDHTTTSRTFYNLLDTGSTYIFSGASGAAGFAVWDSGANWRIIQLECPAT